MDKDKAIKEIKQLKELLDSGILTQNEYDAKSADLKKIILDSENKKNEPSESKKEKEFWEQKAIEKSNAEKEIIPPKKEEKKTNKKTIDKEKIVLKETTIDLSMDIDSDEQKNDERNKIIITDKEQTNTFLSIVLIFPSLILSKVREESLGESMNYAFEKFFSVLIVCAILSLIIFGLRSLIIKKDGAFLTTFYKTTYTVCIINPSLFYLGYFFGYIGRLF